MSLPKKKITISDIAVASAIALFCAAAFFFTFLSSAPSDSFTVSTPNGSETYSLAGDRTIEIVSNGISLIVRVEGGAVYVESSDCPDHVCEQTGRISRTGQSIVCIPARLVIKIGGEESGDVDFIIG